MPQKVSINFESHLNANKRTDVDARASQLTQTNERFHGEIKYLNDITNELSKLMSDINKGYDLIHSKFMQLVNELKVRSTRNSENSLANNSNASDETPQLKSNGHTEAKMDKFQLLAQKFKTPIEHRTRNVFAPKDNNLANQPSESSSNQTGANSKKRSAVLANLSNLGDENRDDSVIECDEEKQKTVKKKTTKSKKAEAGMTEKKKKKKKKVHADNDDDDNKMETELAEAAGKSSPSVSNHLEESEENKKATTKNPSKKIKLNKQKNKQDTNNEEDIEVMDTTLKDEAKLVKQSSKKQKSSDVSEMGEASKVKKKKKKISKQVSVLGADESKAATTPSNNTNIANKISINSILRLSQKKKSLLPQYTKMNINLAKTPSNDNRLSTMKYLQSTIKKSIIRPVQTRAAQRAAAQATSKTLTTTNAAATTSGTQLKATIPTANSTTSLNNKPAETNKSIVSNVKSLASKFNSIATPGQQNRTISNLQQTASKIKTTLRNSIDKRKALSKGKDVKKSVSKEKAIAFLQDNIIKKSDEKACNSNQGSTNNPALMNDSDSDKDGRSSLSSRRSIRMTSDTVANVNNKTDEYIINEMKIKTPTVKLSQMTNSIFTNGYNQVLYSASKFNKLNDPNPRPIPQTISMSSIKGTPSRTFTQTSLTNLQASVQKSAIKPSFAKFLERNTPSKLTQTALDEKRRAELISKDNKEKERLQEMERQKNEKREEIRRRNEEKLKKAAEQKLQKEAEFKQKIENKNTSILANSTHNVQPIKKTFTTSSNHLTAQSSANQQACSNKLQQASTGSNESIVTFKQPVQVPKVQVQAATQEEISDFKKSILNFKNSNILQPSVVLTNDFSLKAHNLNDHNNYNKYASNYTKPSNNLETTYILNSPSSSSSSASSKPNMQQSLLKASFSNYEVTPLQPLKLKNDDNYDVSELQSGDETDDEEEPSKPLPSWAKEPFISDKAKAQSHKTINFTRLFKSASNYEVDLEEIFKIKRKKFTERSSSAIWETPPVWATSGLNGEESFYRVRKGL